MIDGACLSERPHFFIVMSLLAEDPFQMRSALPPLDLPPNFPAQQHLLHHLLVVIALTEHNR